MTVSYVATTFRFNYLITAILWLGVPSLEQKPLQNRNAWVIMRIRVENAKRKRTRVGSSDWRCLPLIRPSSRMPPSPSSSFLLPRLHLIINTYLLGLFIGSQSGVLKALLYSRALGAFPHSMQLSRWRSPLYLAAFGLIVNSLCSPANHHPVLCFPLNHLGRLFTGTHSSPQGLPQDPFPRVLVSHRWAGASPLSIFIPLLYIYDFRRFGAHPVLFWVPSPPKWEVGTQIPLYV